MVHGGPPPRPEAFSASVGNALVVRRQLFAFSRQWPKIWSSKFSESSYLKTLEIQPETVEGVFQGEWPAHAGRDRSKVGLDA